MKSSRSVISILENLSQLPLENVEGQLRFFKRRLLDELRRKKIFFNFHLYVSDDWFCPDGVPGIAMPFYLFHPDLIALEKHHTGIVEGSNLRQQMKLLRHELGHCIDNAYQLRKNKQRQLCFGDSGRNYPKAYKSRPFSRAFVNYLGDGYAQSHPDEDFAETFAVWLDPSSHWRKKYQGTKAFRNRELWDICHRLCTKVYNC